ncbi:MAG: hypothetical protein AAFQ61_12300 [Cyanobacteria bacterium J06626_23]
METALEAKLLSILAITAIALLVVVTGGIVYLTAVEWRDRRRKSRDQLDNLPRKRKMAQTKPAAKKK